jgi:hypothetical protein
LEIDGGDHADEDRRGRAGSLAKSPLGAGVAGQLAVQSFAAVLVELTALALILLARSVTINRSAARARRDTFMVFIEVLLSQSW